MTYGIIQSVLSDAISNISRYQLYLCADLFEIKKVWVRQYLSNQIKGFLDIPVDISELKDYMLFNGSMVFRIHKYVRRH